MAIVRRRRWSPVWGCDDRHRHGPCSVGEPRGVATRPLRSAPSASPPPPPCWHRRGCTRRCCRPAVRGYSDGCAGGALGPISQWHATSESCPRREWRVGVAQGGAAGGCGGCASSSPETRRRGDLTPFLNAPPSSTSAYGPPPRLPRATARPWRRRRGGAAALGQRQQTGGRGEGAAVAATTSSLSSGSCDDHDGIGGGGGSAGSGGEGGDGG